MGKKAWTLTDVSTGTHLDQLAITPADVDGSAEGFSVTKRTLRGGLSDGVDSIRIHNGTLAFDVLPTRGMSLWKAWLGGEDSGWEIGWQSPVRGPVHPQYVPISEPSGLGWLDGFDELLVRCGLESNGAPDFDSDGRLIYPLHGRIGNRPAHKVQVEVDGDSGALSVTGVVDETRFHFAKFRMTSTVQTEQNQPGLRIHDVVENLSASPAEMQVLYHVNFGQPTLDAGSRVVAASKTVVPQTPRSAEGIGSWDSYTAPQPGFEEQVYFLELLADEAGQTRVLLKNAHATRGVSMTYSIKQLPCFTVWTNTTAAADGYVTGLEPATNFPNARTYEGEQRRVVKLAPGASISYDLELHFHATAAEVQQAEKAVAALQGTTQARVFDAPQKGWSV